MVEDSLRSTLTARTSALLSGLPSMSDILGMFLAEVGEWLVRPLTSAEAIPGG